MVTPARRTLAVAVAAAALFALALLLANVGVPEYSHRVHPVALRGTAGLPWAFAFNLLAFVLPGALLAWVGQRLRNGAGDAGWLARIGLVLAQLSAVAFAAQGLLPLDPSDTDSTASRLHVLAWMLWWIAFVPAAVLLAAGARRGAGFALGSVAIGALLPIIAVLAPIGLWVGLAQRLAFALWFGWWLLAAWRLSRT
jgi:branched-subunit amino acid transport protein